MNVTWQWAWRIGACNEAMYIAYLLEKYFLDIFGHSYDMKASFLTEEPDLWFNGGFEDMSVNVAWKWEYLTQMLNNFTVNAHLA